MQQFLAFKACYSLLGKTHKKVSTGQAYEVYARLCEGERLRVLTQRRFSDILSFLDLYGLINARLVSKGRYGSTREISGSLAQEIVERLMRHPR